MVTMVDEIYDRHYREGRAELNAALANAFARLGNAVDNTNNKKNQNEKTTPKETRPRHARTHRLPQEERGLARTALLAYSARSFHFPLE